MTSHWHRLSAAGATFSQHIHRDANFDVRNVLVSLQWTGTKTKNKDTFTENFIHLCYNVSVIALPNVYFQKPSIVEILITNLGWRSLYIGTPVDQKDQHVLAVYQTTLLQCPTTGGTAYV